MTVGGAAALGWDEWHEAEWQAAGRPGPVGRAARVDRGWGSILLAVDDERRCTLEPGTDVAVGDWVVVDTEHDRVSDVLPRRSVLARRAADRAARAQILATNVDVIFLVHALSHAPNSRRLERELVVAFESGASPVVVLNKADVLDDPAELAAAVAEVEETALAVPVVPVSARTGFGVEHLRGHTAGHRTVALVGPSGAGKSTLVNLLSGASGADVQRTGVVRAFDQKGRHTTSAAQLVLLDDGGLLVDTPGLRAVAPWSEGGPGTGPGPGVPGRHDAGRAVPLRRLPPRRRTGVRRPRGGGRGPSRPATPGVVAAPDGRARAAGRRAGVDHPRGSARPAAPRGRVLRR